MRTARRLPALLLAALLAACADEAPPQGPDRETVVRSDLALLQELAREAAQRPGVTCVDARLAADGLPRLEPGRIAVVATTTALPPAQRDALARELAEQVWDSGVSAVGALQVTVVDPASSSDLGLLLGDARGTVFRPRLEQEFGPRPAPAPPESPLPSPAARPESC